MNIYKSTKDPHYFYYKCTFFIEGDYYDIVKILQVTMTIEKVKNRVITMKKHGIYISKAML